MKSNSHYILCFLLLFLFSSCVSKKKFVALETELGVANVQIGKYSESINDYMNRLEKCENEKNRLESEVITVVSNMDLRQEQITDLKDQISDIRKQRDKQLDQVGDLTVLSKEANANIKETLQQLESKDEYIHLLQAAKTKADSMNLALAINLKGELSEGIADRDVEVKVDKTVVFINLSDKMLYQPGSHRITPRATEVLGKIAKIIDDRPGLEVMVEGYTDDQSIRNSCMEDNWDLSVKRATSVVRELQKKYNIDPNRLIAAGRGEYNAMSANDTAEGRALNRRTRIIILPKIDQFYDLLNPNLIQNKNK